MKLIKNLFINLFFFIFFFITADFILGKLMPVYDPSGRMVYSSENGVPLIKKKSAKLRQWKNTGDYNVSVISNKYGLRNSKEFNNVSKNAFYVVGDSHTFGHGVEVNERYSNLLEEEFKIGEFINIAIPTNVDGYYKLLKFSKNKGAVINNIILGLTLENDIHFYEDYKKESLEKKTLKRNYFSALKEFLTTTSSFYSLLTSVIHQNENLKRIAIKMKLVKPAHGNINPFSTTEEIVSTIKYIKKIQLEFKPKNFYVLLLPSRGLWFSKNSEKYFEEHKVVKMILQNQNINVIDPLLEFIKSENPKKYYFKYDGHFNKFGHLLLAEQVYKVLK
jgi:hypothetical protein